MKIKHMTSRSLCTLLAAGTLAATLSACAPLVVGGVAVVGTMMAVDRRTTGIQVEDEGIELRTSNRIRETLGDRAHVNVTSFNRQVLLTGEAATAADRQAAEQIANGVENVRAVVNDLAVMPSTSIGQRSNDVIVTGKVRASLVDAQDISANVFKVVTERNIVYLLGRVTQREANRATEIARGVSGVTKVVRVFEYISDDDVRRMATQPANLSTSPTAQPAAAQPPAPAVQPAQPQGVEVTPLPRMN